MIFEKVNIDIDYEKYGIEHDNSVAKMKLYIKDVYSEAQNKFNRPLVIICPGGGYEHHSPREGEPIALKMLDLGYNAIVLEYSLFPNSFPCQMLELAYAINYAKKHWTEWDIDANKIIVAGFSAGGHVAGCLATLYDKKEVREFVRGELGCEPADIKPNGLLLGYSVLTSGPKAHRLSFERLLRAQKEVLSQEEYNKMLDYVSIEKNVTSDMPKTFLWCTYEDKSVPMENTLCTANALCDAKVPFELHVFPRGPHGMALATKETDDKEGKYLYSEVSVWPELFSRWVEKNL